MVGTYSGNGGAYDFGFTLCALWFAGSMIEACNKAWKPYTTSTWSSTVLRVQMLSQALAVSRNADVQASGPQVVSGCLMKADQAIQVLNVSIR